VVVRRVDGVMNQPCGPLPLLAVTSNFSVL
jgi:hypothetical protein